jgi:hypothetical protein
MVCIYFVTEKIQKILKNHIVVSLAKRGNQNVLMNKSVKLRSKKVCNRFLTGRIRLFNNGVPTAEASYTNELEKTG